MRPVNQFRAREWRVAWGGAPGMTASEVESIARTPQVHEDALRAIAGQPSWVRHYGVVVGLVRNPRTFGGCLHEPAASSVGAEPRLAPTDGLNIPDNVRVTGRRKLVGA